MIAAGLISSAIIDYISGIVDFFRVTQAKGALWRKTLGCITKWELVCSF
jgi:hypothetical protein